jgi:glycerophosphoryl diester phosphodiesterase
MIAAMQQRFDQARTESRREAGSGIALRLPQVIGHRGAAAAAPENTLAAIRKARELGASWIEFDVKLTRDGQAILFHDDRLERTTDGQGAVATATLAAIKRLDAGSWFGPAYRGEPVPTFDEGLMLCAELGLGINVEIKPCRGREAATAEVAMAALLRLWPPAMPVVVSSFARECLGVARAIAPEVPRGHLAERLPRNWRDLMAQHDCATLHLNQRWLGVRQRAAITATGVPLLLYTVNDGNQARRLLDSGVTAVFTDHVDRVLAALGAAGPDPSTAGPAQGWTSDG